MVHVNSRWSSDKIGMLQSAFFNGVGLETWENVWGIWNQMTDRDMEAVRRVAAIEREFAALLTSPAWEPFTPTIHGSDVFASKFPAADRSRVLWTLVNRGTDDLKGGQIEVPYRPGTTYYDLWHGERLTPAIRGNVATLSFDLEGNGFGAVLSVASSSKLPEDFLTEFMPAMKEYSRMPLRSYSDSVAFLPQKIVPIEPTEPAVVASDRMVYIPGGIYDFRVVGTEIEGEEYRNDVQYPWESQPSRSHRQTLTVRPYYIDKYNVTNAEFKEFIDATDYEPDDPANFLKHWTDGTYPSGWEDKPVVWVSIEDARAYARWRGKRLPHEWEWQLAAQGKDNRLYPWGNAFRASAVPKPVTGRVLTAPDAVDSHPQGASPYGVMDLVGNVWQWTDEYADEHTRAAVLRGGSYYTPQDSKWYFPQAFGLNEHSKYLLMSPGRDRSGTIGFRLVRDAPPSSIDKKKDSLPVIGTGQPYRSTATPNHVHLSGEGAADWVHWGATVGRKAGVTKQIQYEAIGNNAPYSDSYVQYSWRDGTPESSGNKIDVGLYAPGEGNGFRIRVPAGLEERTLKLYIGAYKAQGELTVALSDGTLLWSDRSIDNAFDVENGVYEIAYEGNRDGQSLIVTYVLLEDYGNGNVTLQAATLT